MNDKGLDKLSKLMTNTLWQFAQCTTDWAWENTVVLRRVSAFGTQKTYGNNKGSYIWKQPGHFTSMKKLLGLWTRRLSLWWLASVAALGWSKSSSIWKGTGSNKAQFIPAPKSDYRAIIATTVNAHQNPKRLKSQPKHKHKIAAARNQDQDGNNCGMQASTKERTGSYEWHFD